MARKSVIALRNYIHNEAGSVYEQGVAIVEHYIPGTRLHMTVFGQYSFYWPRYKMIWWSMAGSALCTLLHEIGHAKLHKKKFEEAPNPWREYLEEIDAWIWSETACIRLNLKFDYEYALYAIEAYRKKYDFRVSVHPAWKYA